MNKECSRQKILVVDDVEINRLILTELFCDEYEMIEADNGAQALEIIREHKQDIAAILLDIIMPVMDGVELLSQLNKEKYLETTPVVLITGQNDDAKMLTCYSYGAADLIQKPFNPDIVYRRVQNVIKLYGHNRFLKDSLENQRVILEDQSRKLAESTQFVIDALCTTVEFRNVESGEHIRRMRTLTNIILEALKEYYPLSPEDIELISSASSVHDIGKIAIPDSILLKPGPLTPSEVKIMQEHTIRGCEILESLGEVSDSAYYKYCYEICRYHHERYDGNGYPDGLKGEEIPIWAQAASLADVYDALTSKRVYKEAYSHKEAVELILRGECGVFNPIMLDCFLQVQNKLESLSIHAMN